MSHPNPLLPPGSSLEDRKHRKTKILVTVFGIVALHVIPISGLLLMQGCKPENTQIATTTTSEPNDEIPLLNTNDLYRDFEADTTGLSGPIETETPSYELAEHSLEPTISSEVILDEPGEGEVERNPVNTDELVMNNGAVENLGQSYSQAPEVNTPVEVPEVGSPTSSVPEALTLEYTVKPGDRLYSLARTYGTKVEAILGANPGLDPRKLRVGKSIVIPRNSTSSAPSNPVVITPATPNTGGKTYTVKKGDNLTRIARQNSITLSALRKANSLN